MNKTRRRALARAFAMIAANGATTACWRGFKRAWVRHRPFHYAKRAWTSSIPLAVRPRHMRQGDHNA